MEEWERAAIIEGWAVLTRAIGTSLQPGKADSDVGQVVREGAHKLRALQKFAIRQLAELD